MKRPMFFIGYSIRVINLERYYFTFSFAAAAAMAR